MKFPLLFQRKNYYKKKIVKQSNVSIRNLIFYSLPVFAGGSINFLLANYYMKYATDVLLISPVIMGSIFFVSRIWDAVNDPIIGFLSDKSSSKKKWIFASSIPIVIFFAMIWLVPFDNYNFRVAWVLVFVLLLFTALTGLYVPHYSLGAELSSDYHEKNKIFGVRAFSENLGNFAGVGVMSILVEAVHPQVAVFSYVPILSIIFFLFIISISFVKISSRNNRKEKIKLLESFQTVFRNKEARKILLAGLGSQMAATFLMGMMLYYSEYVLDSKKSAEMFIALFMISATLSLPLWILIAKKFEKQKLWIFSMLILSLGFLFTLLLNPKNVDYLWIYSVTLGTFAGCILLLHPSMLSDIIDIDEQKTGILKEGIYFSVFTFVNKSAMGFAVILIGFVLSFWGYKANQIQSNAVKNAIRYSFAFVPMIIKCC